MPTHIQPPIQSTHTMNDYAVGRAPFILSSGISLSLDLWYITTYIHGG